MFDVMIKLVCLYLDGGCVRKVGGDVYFVFEYLVC